MAVFTLIAENDFVEWAGDRFPIRGVSALTPISEGIENTNYRFRADGGDFVFTVFEVWERPQVEYYAALLAHLDEAGVPAPRPVGDRVDVWAGKPCVIVPFFEGESLLSPTVEHCRLMGGQVAALHRAVAGFVPRMANPRGFAWRREAVRAVRERMPDSQRVLLDSAVRCDGDFSALPLPTGACHCDLFRNNVLWQDGGISAIIDFYFGGDDALVFDLAVCACDWCFDAGEGRFDSERLSALLGGYAEGRRLTDMERHYFPDALCVAALRFWLSRHYDLFFPRAAESLTPHDPGQFEAILRDACSHRDGLRQWLRTVA